MTSALVVLIFGALLSCGPDSSLGPTSPGAEPASEGETGSAEKFSLWLQPGYFRGYNVGYYNYNTGTKTVEDFRNLKGTGANLAQIQSTEGTRDWAYPYALNPDGLDSLEEMVRFCNRVGLKYVIAVREGPGRQTVDEEARDSIWENATEQQLYAEMLRDDILVPYRNDPLFVGINLMVEPNPLNQEIDDGPIETPQDLSRAMAARGIDVNTMMAQFISAVRSVDATLPVIVQSVGWSDPSWWELLEKQSDPYVIYDFHTYEPYGLTHPDCERPSCGGISYPGVYWGETWNRNHIENTHLAEVIRFQQEHDVPILMGEFGLQFEQRGGVRFLSDHVDIALRHGWHFCLWNFRSDSLDPDVLDFDYEKWSPAYWDEILSWFE
jgi:hypothetical protein